MARPAAKVLLHPGFHKTGTSSAQHFLADNRALLAPHLQIMLMSALGAAEKPARRFSKTRRTADLIEFGAAIQHCLTGFAPDPARPLLLSCEGLAGEIPGRNSVLDYSALPELAPIVIAAVAALGYARSDIALYFSLRQPAPWLRSAYAHNIRSTRLTLDFDTFAKTYADAANLPAMVDRVGAACRGQHITTCWLEETTKARFGPATPLLAPFDLSETLMQSLAPPRLVNPGLDPELTDRFLALNRGSLPLDALKAEKARIAAQENPAAALRAGGPPKGTET